GIIADSALFEQLEQQMAEVLKKDRAILTKIIARCCEIKAAVVSQDETESGLRAILNFGHTIGHALEAISGYNKFLHGEAISIGQVAAARLSHQTLGLERKAVNRIENLFKRAGLPLHIQLNRAQEKRLLEAMQLDKKVSAGEARFVLARKIGTVETGHSVSPGWIKQALKATE